MRFSAMRCAKVEFVALNETVTAIAPSKAV
jgi:hypothetical protein